MSRPPLSPGSQGRRVLPDSLTPARLITRTRPTASRQFRQLRAAILQKSPRFAHFRRTSANIPHVFPHNIPHNQETPAAWDC